MMNAKKLQKEADAEAKKAMAEAKKFLDVNVYEALSIQMKPYELEREALASAGAQAIEAGRESERTAAATAGRIQAQQNLEQRDIQVRQGQEMADLQKLTAAEASRLKDVKTQIALDEVAGAQVASANQQERAAYAAKNAIAGVTSLVGQAAKLPALYGSNLKAEQEAFSNLKLNADQLQKLGNINYEGLGPAQTGPQAAGMGPANYNEGMFIPTAVSNFDPMAISQMSRSQYKDFVNSLTTEQRRILFGNKQFGELYDAAVARQNKFLGMSPY